MSPTGGGRAAPTRPRPTVISNLFFLALRRMRGPLILVVAIYAFCVIGLAIMPGIDADGHPTPGIGLFHAFYVVSYVGTTIGLGEIPSEYSVHQRLWLTLTIYLTVSGWTYTIMRTIALVGDRGFQQSIQAAQFGRRIRSLREPFYIVCGGGETGTLVAHGLDRLGYRPVIVDQDAERIQELRFEIFSADVPGLAGDATLPMTLQEAGLESPWCRGVMALTSNDTTNRAIAVNVRLLAPHVRVLARASDVVGDGRLGPFGGDIVINPFERFAEHLVAAVSAPESYQLREILTGLPDERVPEPHHPPRGHWIICGYGRFGHITRAELEAAGMTVTVIDHLHFGERGVDIDGTGTEAQSLIDAHIETSQGIIAGNANDQKNLAIAIAARDLNPDIFIVTRQNMAANAALFAAFEHDLSMVPGRVVAREFLALITTPLLSRFLEIIPQQDEEWCADLVKRLTRIDRHHVPETWSFDIDEEHAGAVCRTLAAGDEVTIGHLCALPYDRRRRSRALALLLVRDDAITPLPDDTEPLRQGDSLLFASSEPARRLVASVVSNPNVLDYIRTGAEAPGGWVWRWHTRRRKTELTPH